MPSNLVAIQNALVSILHHLEDAEHTSDPEYHSGSMDDAEEAAVQGLKQLPTVLANPPLHDHAVEELKEPEHEEPHEKKEVASPEDEKGDAQELKDLTGKQALHKLAHSLCLTGPSRAERHSEAAFRRVVTNGLLDRMDRLFSIGD
jgi:hypothetical protein